MKINRFIALAAIALLAMAAMGAISMKVFAQPAAQTQNCDGQDEDTAEVQDVPDTDNVDLVCGDQNEADEEKNVGDQNEADDAEVESADAAPTGTPAITADAAQKTAETYLKAGTAIKVELDDEDGKLVYSVEFANNTDVKVDAMTGEVLGTEPTED